MVFEEAHLLFARSRWNWLDVQQAAVVGCTPLLPHLLCFYQEVIALSQIRDFAQRSLLLSFQD